MEHKTLAWARIVVVVLAVAAVTAAALPAYAHSLLPPPGPESMPDNNVPADLPVSLPDPVLTGGATAPSGFSPIPRDDRDNSTPTAW